MINQVAVRYALYSLLCCASVVCPAATGQSLSLPAFGTVSGASEQAWKAFRAAQPFQAQLVAIAKGTQGHPGTLIVSEPPPRVTWDKLQPRLAHISTGCVVRRWDVMHDGWVHDIVCTLKPDNARLADGIAQLNRELYGAADNPVVQLPSPKRTMIARDMDLKYSAADLHRWLNEDHTYRNSAVGDAVKFPAISRGAAAGVFTRSDGNLVLWAIPRGNSLTGSDADIRRFALASDIVLGAVANASTVVVVGRGRVESLSHFPPLRSETVLLLAGTPEQELAQSYERNDILAGKSSNGVDYAPILLSPQLVDTEFGTLLNLADQLLKGWSMAGKVRYSEFPYPAPRTYPFGDTPAPYVKDRPGDFLFNWNTDGAAYGASIGGLDVVVPQRTGALSVIYGDVKARPRDMEAVAYDYFAKTGDTSLARVVQYTLLFQIFRRFDVRADRPPVSPRHAGFARSLDEATVERLRYLLANPKSTDLHDRIKKHWATSMARLTPVELAELGASREEMVASQTRLSLAIADTLATAEQASSVSLVNAIGEVASLYRQRRKLTPAEHERFNSADKALHAALPRRIAEEIVKNQPDVFKGSGLMAIAADKLGDWAKLSDPASRHFAWTRTAYVVASKGSAAAIGGHNIDAPMVRFQQDSALAKGQISVTKDSSGNTVVAHSPGDATHMNTIAREVGTRKALSVEKIEADVVAALRNSRESVPVPLNAIRSAVHAKQSLASEFRFLQPAEAGYRSRPLLANEQTLLTELGSKTDKAVVFEQLGDGTFVLTRPGSETALHVSSLHAATDALANGLVSSAGGSSPVTVLMKGVAGEKAEAMLLHVQSSLRRYPKKTVDHILSTGDGGKLLIERPALLNARIAHNGLRIDRLAVKVQKVDSGAYAGYTRVEVPITVQARTPFYMRIVFFLKDMSAASLELLLGKLSTALATIRAPMSYVEMKVAIRQQLAADLRALNVDAVLLHPGSDAPDKLHHVIIGDNGHKALDAA